MTASQLGRPWVDHEIIDGAYTGDLNAFDVKILKAFNEEQEGPPDRLAQGGRKSVELAEERDALLKKATNTYRLMALLREDWDDAKAKHPPRKGEDGEVVEADKDQGVDVTTFFEAVMAETFVTPDSDPYKPERLFSDRECESFIAQLSKPDWRELCSAVWVLNEMGVGVPKLSMASLLRQRIADASEPPEQSEEASPPSTGGQRLAGQSTSTQTAG